MKKFFALVIAGSCLLMAQAPAPNSQEPIESNTIIRSETRLVLVDSVVTDKKGNYVHGLTQKDFKVYEDNKEQNITSFSFETDANAPDSSRKHYLVLFFDNSTVPPGQQNYSRDAAMKFIDKNAGPNRLMAIAEFGGALKISQNFTDDADRLKQVVNGVKFSSVGAASGGGPRIPGFTNFSTRGVLGALRDMAKGLANVPGRKTLIFLSAGFPMTNPDVITEVTATIDACNRANVAIYPIDVRGLVAPTVGGFIGSLTGPGSLAQLAMLNAGSLVGPLAFLQGRGGGSGGTSSGGSSGGTSSGGSNAGGGKAPGSGGTSSGGIGGVSSRPVSSPSTGATSGSRANTGGGGGVANPNMTPANQAIMANRNRVMPTIDKGISGNQEVLYALANGTGGFVIVNTNDLLGGLEKIGREQNEYYILGYSPSRESEPGVCHTLKVKVDKAGNVRARSGYCEAKGADVLSGTPAERDLEARMSGNVQSNVAAASMQAPYFYISPNTARVNVALDVPPGAIKFVKEKGKYQAVMNVVGIAYLSDGGVGARFSDSVHLSFDDQKEAQAFEARPYHYVKQFESAPGKFMLKVVFSSSADQFGKVEAPLTVDPWEGTQFALSGLVLSKEVHPAKEMMGGLDKDLLENRVPLVVNGVQIIPAGTNHFSKTGNGYIYAEIYEPALALPDTKEPPALGVDLRLLDGKGAVIKDYGLSRLNHNGQLGNPAVPLALVLNVKDMEVGSYQIAVTAVDEANHQVTRVLPIQIDN